jgi:adenylosuccinate lyase
MSRKSSACGRAGLDPGDPARPPRDVLRHARRDRQSIERLATEVRHLQRTEVLEAEEYFSPGQKGSSAMPHKRNPVLTENLTGLARMVRAYAMPALENVALWHERDISHSSVERFIGPDACITLDFALARLTGVIDKLLVYPERMQRTSTAWAASSIRSACCWR